MSASGPPGRTAPAASQQPPGSARPWPSVAVVIPTRNRPDLLARSVQSIVDQSYPGAVECIVVFDASEPAPVDATVPGGRTLRLITNTRRPGLAGARNSGIVAGTSDLVAFCDDDDAWLPGKLSLQVERLEATAAEFVSCGTRFHYADRVTERAAPASVDLQQLARRRYPELGAPTFLIRRDALDQIGLIDEDIPGSYGEDYDLLLRAARRGPIVAVEQPLIDVYWHQQSFFADRWQTIADGLRYLLDKHPELRADRRGLARIQGQIAFAEAALARRSLACRSSSQALRNYPLERRAYVALAVASGVVPAVSVARMANRRGRGI
jgi:glycosyltransferase involved in cell wall biosynthesis